MVEVLHALANKHVDYLVSDRERQDSVQNLEDEHLSLDENFSFFGHDCLVHTWDHTIGFQGGDDVFETRLKTFK